MNQRNVTLLFNFYSIFIGVLLIGFILENNVVVVVTGFAAAASSNNSNKKSKKLLTTTSSTSSTTGSNNKGFGSNNKKESTIENNNFQEIVSKFRNRIPYNSSDIICPCGLSNDKSYKDCCEPYHNNILQPETPIRVLQTRYTAFKYRIIPYIIQTIHPNNPDYRTNQIIWAKDLNREGMFDSYDFLGLEDVIIQQEQNNTNNTPDEDIIKTTTNDIDNNNQVLIDNCNDNNEAFITFKVRLRSRDTKQQEVVIVERSQFLRTDEGKWLYAKGEVRSG